MKTLHCGKGSQYLSKSYRGKKPDLPEGFIEMNRPKPPRGEWVAGEDGEWLKVAPTLSRNDARKAMALEYKKAKLRFDGLGSASGDVNAAALAVSAGDATPLQVLMVAASAGIEFDAPSTMTDVYSIHAGLTASQIELITSEAESLEEESLDHIFGGSELHKLLKTRKKELSDDEEANYAALEALINDYEEFFNP